MARLFRGNELRVAAQDRWLQPEEILEILDSYPSLGFFLSTSPPRNPRDGDVYIFDRTKVRDFKNDGLDWIRKNNEPGRIREDYIKISVRGEFLITGFYTHCRENTSFSRRCYRHATEGSVLFFVHYRNSVDSTSKKGLNELKLKSESMMGIKQKPSLNESILPEEFKSYDFDSSSFSDNTIWGNVVEYSTGVSDQTAFNFNDRETDELVLRLFDVADNCDSSFSQDSMQIKDPCEMSASAAAFADTTLPDFSSSRSHELSGFERTQSQRFITSIVDFAPTSGTFQDHYTRSMSRFQFYFILFS